MTPRPLTRARTREAEVGRLETVRAAFPRRAGDNPWPEALVEIRARLAEGHTWQEILDGCRRYSAFCAASGATGSVFVMRAGKFCGPAKHFLEQWHLPAVTDRRTAAEVAWTLVLSGGHLERGSPAARAAATVGGQYAIRHAHIGRELPYMHRRFLDAFMALVEVDSASDTVHEIACGDAP